MSLDIEATPAGLDPPPPARTLGFLLIQTPRTGPTLQLPPGTKLDGLPADAELCGFAASHLAFLSRNLAGLRRLLGAATTQATDAVDKAFPWAGFTVVPFWTSTSCAAASDAPFGNQVPPDKLQPMLDALGLAGQNAWTTDLEGLLSVCYYGTHDPRRIGRLLAAFLHSRPGMADMDSGCQIESRPASNTVRIYFHTAETWMRSAGRSLGTASARRKAYAMWRYETMKVALVLHSLYQVPYEVVRAAPKGPLRTMELRAIGDPWLVDSRPCSIAIDRASEMRVVAYRFGSEMTLFHYVYLVDPLGNEHFYAAYYCLLQDSESALLQYLAGLAEKHRLTFTPQTEDTDAPFE